MKRLRSILCIMLTLCLLVGIIPARVNATEELGSMTTETANSGDSQLSEAPLQEQAEETSGGYGLFDLTIVGNTAIVEYSSLEEANLVVALYTKEGQQLFSSATVKVDPEATKATVTLQETMPENFVATAYLVDVYDYAPLCEPYSTPAIISCGTCGDNVTWILYGSGLLNIQGNGKMYGGTGPWYKYKDSILEAVISEGVTSIGSRAFYECFNLVSIEIPKGVTSIGEYAFYDCLGLTSITLPEGVTTIGSWAFMRCKKLEKITIPNSVTSIGDAVFGECASLTDIVLPPNVTSYGTGVFALSGLTGITIPNGVTSIGRGAFMACFNLATVTIPKSVTQIDEMAFSLCTNLKEVHYGGDTTDWENLCQSGVGDSNTELMNATVYFADGTASAAVNPTDAVQGAVKAESAAVEDLFVQEETYQSPAMNAVINGEYTTDSDGVKTASFSGLVPGEQYVLLTLVSNDVEDLLSPENLLYISQTAAAEDGSLVFTYVQRIATDTAYVMLCGPSDKNLQDAVITFPNMKADATVQTVNPTVTYAGETLTKGVDYVVLGESEFTKGGTYTCYIRGIHQYSGLVTCTYTVEADRLLGDVTGDGKVTATDYSRLLAHVKKVNLITDESALAAADVTGDGKITATDYSRLLAHVKKVAPLW